MSKKILLASTVALVFALTASAFAGWPGETLVSETTVNWTGAGHFWGDHTVVGAGMANFDTMGDLCNGYFTGRTYAGNSPHGFDPPVPPPLVASRISAQVTNGWIEHTQERLGPDPMYNYVPAPPGEYSESYLEVWAGTGALAMTTYTNEAHTPQVDSSLGGPYAPAGPTPLPFNYCESFIADVDIDVGSYYMERNIEASDGDRVEITAGGAGYAYMESLTTGMGQDSAVCGHVLYPKGYAFNAVTGPGQWQIEGYGHAEVVKELGYTTTGPMVITAHTADATGLHAYGDGVTTDSAFLGMYATWGAGWNITNYGMTAK